MFDLMLDDEQKMLVKSIGRFNNDQIQDVYRDADEEGQIPQDVIQLGWEFGLLPSTIPEAYGGFGEYSAVTGAIAYEAFAHGDLAIALNITSPAQIAIPIMLSGTEAQKKQYLPQFCGEEPPKHSAALTEPKTQFDPRNLATTATLAEGGYLLNGVKCLVSLAGSADMILVYANEAGVTQAFLVPCESEGLELGPREKLMGIRALPTFGMTLTDCFIPFQNKLGGDSGIDFDVILNHSRVALAAAAVGMAKAGYEYALDYAKNRVQFDEPIAHRQSIAFMLAEMAIEVDAARLLVWETAWKLDQGHDVTREATIMKYQVDQMVMQVADQAVQTLGGYGYIREFPAELWFRNARGFASFEGLAIL